MFSGQRSTSEMVNARDNGVYMTNIAHIISLTADNLVVECGGVGKLVNEITVPGKVGFRLLLVFFLEACDFDWL